MGGSLALSLWRPPIFRGSAHSMRCCTEFCRELRCYLYLVYIAPHRIRSAIDLGEKVGLALPFGVCVIPKQTGTPGHGRQYRIVGGTTQGLVSGISMWEGCAGRSPGAYRAAGCRRLV